MGFIENNKALCMLSVLINTHLLMAAQARGRRTIFLRVVGVRLCRGQANGPERHGVEGRRRLSGDARRRLRLGKTFQRTDVPAFPGRFRLNDPRRALSQRLRPARHVRWRPRKSAGGDLPQSDRGETSGKHEIEIWGDGHQTRSFM